MIKVDLNNNWHYGHIGMRDRREISLPHDAMLSEKRTPESKGEVNTGWYEGYDYWYEKEFRVEECYPSQRVILEFEGVYKDGEVYLNGELVGSRPYGYSSFSFDVTDRLKEDLNLLRVTARNADQPNSRWYSGAGIYRPVNLYILPAKHLELYGVQVKTVDYERRQVEVKLNTTYQGTAEISLTRGDTVLASEKREISGSTSLCYELKGTPLWSPSSPELCRCKVNFEGDERVVSFGIREIACDSENGFRINGERIILRGSCIHHDNGILGACAYDSAEKRKVRILQEAGYNAIRSAHNPCSRALLEACDEAGMLVMDEFVDCWYIHKTKHDYVTHFDKWYKADLKSMVEKDYNHPSVIMYSTGNEVSETAQKKGIELTGEMTDYLHGLDDTRPVTCGINIFFNFLSSIGLGVYSDDKAEKAAKDKDKKKAVGSEFYNNLAGLLGDEFMKRGATLGACDRKTKDAFANMDVAGYNYGILRYKKDLKKYPKRVILGTETFCKDALKSMKQAQDNNGLIGDFVWSGMDYLGEVGIGSREYRSYAKTLTPSPGWISAGSGRIDLTGQELAEALYTKVAFGIDKIHMAVIPVDDFKNPHSPSAWKMTNARSSWSWRGFEGAPTRVEVYADAHKVALYINDHLIGKKKCGKSGRTYFKTKYYSGELKATSFDRKGDVIASTVLKTASEETRLSIEPEQKKVKRNELAYVRFRYTDGDGILKPLERGRITLKVSGGTLLGFGHGCPYNDEGYLNDYSDTYYGEALAIIKPEGNLLVLNGESPLGEARCEIPVEE